MTLYLAPVRFTCQTHTRVVQQSRARIKLLHKSPHHLSPSRSDEVLQNKGHDNYSGHGPSGNKRGETQGMTKARFHSPCPALLTGCLINRRHTDCDHHGNQRPVLYRSQVTAVSPGFSLCDDLAYSALTSRSEAVHQFVVIVV